MAQGVILLSPTNIPLAIRDCMLVKTLWVMLPTY